MRVLGQLSTYDPAAGRISLRRSATAYDLAHERVHHVQCEIQTLAWRMDRAIGRVPYVGRWTRLWVEYEATALALAALTETRKWTPETEKEAWRMWRTYLWACIAPWM